MEAAGGTVARPDAPDARRGPDRAVAAVLARLTDPQPHRAPAPTRRQVLDRAAQLASVHGLNGVTIGRLAADLGMSKSGLHAQFGSKEGLQLATVRAALEVFIDKVAEPALREPVGLPRLAALCRLWLDYARARVFAGGCFFCNANAEFGATPGPVRDLLADVRRLWLEGLADAVNDAQELDHLRRNEVPAQLAFELDAFFGAANTAGQLMGDHQDAHARAVAAAHFRLVAAGADPAAL